MKDSLRAKISEIFTSIQGEGPYLGQRQTFLRFYGCNLACKFCDTKQEHFFQYTCEQLLNIIKKQAHAQILSITGGEPLLQAQFLQQFLPDLKKEKFRIYLETNGTLVKELISLIDFVDIIAMDFKLPSSTGERSYFREHEEFLRLAAGREVFVKAVITDSTTLTDIKTAVEIIAKIDKAIIFVLQPDTNKLSHALFKRAAEYRAYSSEHLDNVRMICQMHKLMGVK